MPIAALTSAAAVDIFQGNAERVPPKEFRIFPAGIVSTMKGDFLFDEAAANAVMASYRQHAVDLTIDYDHHTLSAPMGVKAVSAGWFHLAVRNGELWATDVNWTLPAAQYLARGEYRYFSPLFDYERGSNRITNLINNALTNTPAMDGIEALVAASALVANFSRKEDHDMLTPAQERKILAGLFVESQLDGVMEQIGADEVARVALSAGGSAGLTALELKMCSKMGLDPVKYLAAYPR
jgi:phage I-like protein